MGLKSEVRSFAGPSLEPLQSLSGPEGAEGYRLCVRKGETNSGVYVLGNDMRGVLFGVGRLLRELHWGRGRVWAPDALDIATAPKYRLRGHQLGYRPKCNSYDAWDLPVWEQYFRDLAVFGCNAVELIPPRSDDAADSPHFPRPPMEMMAGMSRLAAAYGLDVWVWYPAMDAGLFGCAGPWSRPSRSGAGSSRGSAVWMRSSCPEATRAIRARST